MRRVVIGLLLVVAVGMFWLAGRNGNADPEPVVSESAVEQLIPADGSPSVLRQAEIGIDLKDGWTGELSVNGVFIPEDQLRRNEPLAQLFFTPGPGKEIEQFRSGTVVVVASIWRPIDGETRDDARQVVWRFKVL
ncbi:MAG TPA: hypothetical protein VFU93_10080 [Acidimicrobiales bacterium]|nr:hypothetical protein [Acidimicrobiales bacterium]